MRTNVAQIMEYCRTHTNHGILWKTICDHVTEQLYQQLLRSILVVVVVVVAVIVVVLWLLWLMWCCGCSGSLWLLWSVLLCLLWLLWWVLAVDPEFNAALVASANAIPIHPSRYNRHCVIVVIVIVSLLLFESAVGVSEARWLSCWYLVR